MSEETKKCPYCAETIKIEAIVCRYCGRELTIANSPQQQPVVIQERKPPQQESNTNNVSKETTVNSKNSRLATNTVVFGILAILLALLLGPNWGFWMGAGTVVTGGIALYRIGKQQGEGKGTAKTGIVLGILAIIIQPCLLILYLLWFSP